jgi:hypothetical protein
MTDTITEMVLPALSAQPNVEIAMTGQWDISTGRVTLTDDDFSNAIAALDCPAVRKPVLKLGHTDTRFNQPVGDGQPTVGWIDNMATTDSGHTIVGDYVGMPGWLGPILPSAYPDRSMEATWDFMCQLGHVHPFVITAVALLGETPPGIGTLESLQDVASLYGVDMAASRSMHDRGFSVSIHASKGAPTMPNPNPREVAAGVTTEDIRRTYYETAPYSVWIKEFELDPLQLIVTDEADGSYSRIPVTLENGEFTFGDAIPVEIEYVDKPEDANSGTTAAASAGSRIVYASRDESRPATAGNKPPVQAAPKPVTPAEVAKRVHGAPIKAAETGRESGEMDPAKIREALGLAADASDDDVIAAATALRQPNTDPAPNSDPAPAAPVAAGAGVVVLDQSVVTELQKQAERGNHAYEMMRKNERDSIISAAINDGKFAPGRREYWEKLWDADPDGTRTQIETLAKNLVPLAASGYAGAEGYEQDETYFAMYPEDRPTREGVR